VFSKNCFLSCFQTTNNKQLLFLLYQDKIHNPSKIDFVLSNWNRTSKNLTEMANQIALHTLMSIGMPEDEALSQLDSGKINLTSYSENVTDDVVIALAENCDWLISISLWFCSKITDTALIAIAENCPELTAINLRHCRNLTDTALTAVAEHCGDLTDVDLNCCINITNATVIAFATNCPGLTNIDLGRCDYVTDTAVIALGENCEYLQKIHVLPVPFGCDPPGIGWEGLQIIEEINARPKHPSLEDGWMDDGTGPRCKGQMN
jgi:hypothetical protein